MSIINIPDSTVDLLLRSAVKRFNKLVDLRTMPDIEEIEDEHRTINIRIIDRKDGNVPGLTFANSKLIEIGEVRSPNIELSMTKQVFLAICFRKVTSQQAIYYGQADVQGEHWVRDLKILNPIFNVLSGVLEDIV